MAEPALALRDHPQIIDLISVLEQSGLQKQKEEVQALVGYIDGMEEKLSQMMDEMKEDRKSTRLNSSHKVQSRMPSSA